MAPQAGVCLGQGGQGEFRVRWIALPEAPLAQPHRRQPCRHRHCLPASRLCLTRWRRADSRYGRCFPHREDVPAGDPRGPPRRFPPRGRQVSARQQRPGRNGAPSGHRPMVVLPAAWEWPGGPRAVSSDGGKRLPGRLAALAAPPSSGQRNPRRSRPPASRLCLRPGGVARAQPRQPASRQCCIVPWRPTTQLAAAAALCSPCGHRRRRNHSTSAATLNTVCLAALPAQARRPGVCQVRRRVPVL